MQPISVIPRLAMALVTGLLASWVLVPSVSAQPQAGDILVVDTDVPPLSTAVLFQVDPQTGARTVLSDFGATSPSAVAVEADGGILVTDMDAGTDPSGGTSEWGVLYRVTSDPVTGEVTRAVLTDFGVGPNTGRNPRAVAVGADGEILAISGSGGTSNRALLVRVDPRTGAREIVSDFGNIGQGGLGVEPRGVGFEAGGGIVVIDAQAGQGETGNGQGVLFRIGRQTGFRASVSNFGVGANQGSNPTSVAVEASGQILVTDEGHTSTTPLGLLFRVDRQSGLRTVLSDFNTGANSGREPEGVALEADGQILVVDKHGGALTRGMLFRVDPQTGARAIVSDFAVGPNGGGDPLALAVVPPTRATLNVVNEVVNDNGGSADASDWTVSVEGDTPAPASFRGAETPGTSVTLDPGAYSVSASGHAGYHSTLSPDCAGTLAVGETKTCTITHDDQAASLFVAFEIVNDNSGSAAISDWTVSVSGGNPSRAKFAGEGTPGTEVTLDAGRYAVSQNGAPGYSATQSADCAGTIAPGESKSCTITLDDLPGTLVVVHRVNNNHLGTAQPSDWGITVTGDNPMPSSFRGAAAPGTSVTLNPGAYTVRETRESDRTYGYTTDRSRDCDPPTPIAAGETRTCTISHYDHPAPLTAVSEVVNDNGGTAVASDWTITVTTSSAPPRSFAGTTAPGFLIPLGAGDYSVSWAGPPGYTSRAGPGCSGSVVMWDVFDCLIVHDDQPPDAVPPDIACGAPDGAWHGANVSIDCTAEDHGSGLADPADTAFSLSTSVPAGDEDGNASTDSRRVCDVAGNCAEAGPIGGHKIDRKSPTLSLPSDKTVDATLSAGATVSYVSSASDGADPHPGVSCSPSPASVFAIGTTSVTCTARDHVGNTTAGSFTVTVRSAKQQLARLIQDVVAASKLPAAIKAGLLARLQPLLAAFDPGNAAQRRTVCAGLATFTAVVRLLSGPGITPTQAAAWIADATRIRAVIGC